MKLRPLTSQSIGGGRGAGGSTKIAKLTQVFTTWIQERIGLVVFRR